MIQGNYYLRLWYKFMFKSISHFYFIIIFQLVFGVFCYQFLIIALISMVNKIAINACVMWRSSITIYWSTLVLLGPQPIRYARLWLINVIGEWESTTDHLSFLRASVLSVRMSRYIMHLNRKSEWKVMTNLIAQELPLFNFEHLDILCAWIWPPS